MPQYVVYRNNNPAAQKRIPLLLNVQSDLLDELETRVVIPLYGISHAQNMVMSTLTPEIEVEGEQYILMTPQLAGISKKDLGERILSVEHRRYDIIAAIDLLISGA